MLWQFSQTGRKLLKEIKISCKRRTQVDIVEMIHLHQKIDFKKMVLLKLKGKIF